jgi:predicted ribonuclease YlaK
LWIPGKAEPVLAIYKKLSNKFVYVASPNKGDKKNYPLPGCRLSPPNHRLAFLYALAADPSVKKLFINGVYGSGKTTVAIDVMTSLIPNYISGSTKYSKYEKGLYVRRMQALRGQRDGGSLPGNAYQKAKSYYDPFFDAMDFIFGEDLANINDKRTKEDNNRQKKRRPLSMEDFVFENFINEGLLSLSTIDAMAGRSLGKTDIYIDESQDLNPEQFLLLSTRGKDNSKLIMGGEIKISNDEKLSANTNGLAIAFQYGHELQKDKIAFVTLTQSLREEDGEEWIEAYRRGII